MDGGAGKARPASARTSAIAEIATPPAGRGRQGWGPAERSDTVAGLHQQRGAGPSIGRLFGAASPDRTARSVPSVLVIGLDGATWRVLAPWAAAGRLPHLAALMERGAWGTL